MEIRKRDSPLFGEIIFRILLWAAFILTELVTPFHRVILAEEMWMYQYPHTGFQYVPPSLLWMISIVFPMTILLLDYARTRNWPRCCRGILSLTLLLGLNGFITVLLKVIVGRPRPDFFYRCFPDGVGNEKMACTGDRKAVLEGRKSFPSGHASFAFTSMVFVSLYTSQRLKIFDAHRGCAWRLLLCISPLIVATGVAVSRTCDYHHHWQDVTCGGVIGSVIAYVCYYQYFAIPTCTFKPSASQEQVVNN